MRVTLLGPQRLIPSLAVAMRALGDEGSIATVTAGWREREGDDAELNAILDGRGRNLALYRRWSDVLSSDPEYARAERGLRDELDELRDVYEVRLDHALRAVEAVQRSTALPPVRDHAIGDAIGEIRRLDTWHLRLVAEARAHFDAGWAPAERDIVRRHRDEVAQQLAECRTIAIAGGHVAVLLQCLRLFEVMTPRTPRTPPGTMPGTMPGTLSERPPETMPESVVAWSAGAMALAERVVLFHDFVPQGPSGPEVYDVGLGVVRGIVPLPHARRRLRLKDPARTAVLARRFAPARCLVLDDGVRVDLGVDGRLPATARIVTAEGSVVPLGEAA